MKTNTMSALQIEQMIIPAGVAPTTVLPIDIVEVGSFITFPDQGNKLYFVSRHGNSYIYFPVLADGTISGVIEFPNIMDCLMGRPVMVFFGSQLPDLQIVDNKIVWAK